jgi:hypothetical protein
MFVFTPQVSGNNTQFMWGTSSSSKRLSVHLMRDSSGRMVVDHGSNLGGGRYSLTTSTLVLLPPLISMSAMSLGEKLLTAVPVLAVFSALDTCAGNLCKKR